VQDPYLSRGKAAKFLGCHPNTLRRWEESGELVPDHVTDGGHARYSHRLLRAFQKRHSTLAEDEPKTILYARVAAQDRATDLAQQVQRLKAYCAKAGEVYDEVWTEIGSGVKHRRPKLRRMLREASEGQLAKVVVVHGDRLSTTAAELIEDVLARAGVELIALDDGAAPYDVSELADDLRDLVRDLWRQTGRPGHSGKRAGLLASELAREFEGSDAEH
jgi:putative resolvase